jgi:hypothetical protein
MEKFTPPVTKPDTFGVSDQEVTELASRLRSGLPQEERYSESRSLTNGAGAGGTASAAPRAKIF